MRKITNTEENNQYYKLVNEYINDYINEWRIKPSKLKRYFNNSDKMNSFLKRYKLDDVEGIKRVVNDVIDDHHFIEKDGIMSFEKFNYLSEGLGKIVISPIDINYERILADLYNTSVGHINITNEKEHKYKVSDFGKEVNTIVYSKNDIEEFKKSITPILISDVKSKPVEIFKVDLGLESGKEIKVNINLDFDKIVYENKLKELIEDSLSQEKLLSIIFHFVNDYEILRSGNHYVYKEEYKGYHIWELQPRKNSKSVTS